MLTNPFIIKKIGEILAKTIPGTGGGVSDPILEKIKDVMGQPQTSPAEEPEEVRAVKGEYEGPEIDDWDEEDDDDKAEKEASKTAWHALKEVHKREWESLKQRHEAERDALKNEHESERGDLRGRVDHAYKSKSERRGGKHEGKHKDKGRGHGRDGDNHPGRGKGRGKGKGPKR